MCPSGANSRPQSVSISEIRPAFDVLDTDRDGKISINDLRSFYSAFPNNNSTTTTAGADDDDDENISSMISVADSNKDGFVGPDEFEKVVLGVNGSDSLENEVMREVFEVMDRDGDGKLGFDDLKNYMNLAGFHDINDEDIRVMIKLGDGDENEGVSFQGMLKILAVDSSPRYY